MAEIKISNKTSHSFVAQVVNLDQSYEKNDRTIEWYIDNKFYDDGRIGAGDPSSGEVTFTGLKSDTQYFVEAKITYDTDTSPTTLTIPKSVTTNKEEQPEQPTWSASIVKEISNVPSGYNRSFMASKYTVYKYRVSFDNSGIATFYTKGSGNTYGYLSKTPSFNNNSGEPSSPSTSDAVDNGTDFRFTYNVKKVAHYYLWVRFSNGDRSGNIELHIDPPIEPWSWEASNGSATSAQTIKAYQAVTNKTAVSDFSYLVWNDMVDKVKEILDTLGWDWDSLYATYAKTRISSSNKTLTAAKFNSLRYNIGSHYSTGIYEVSPGDEVLGSYFITLTSCINSWIEQDLSG